MKLEYLRPLVERPGPWASVYLDASRDGADAAAQLDKRWRALRAALTEQGCDEPTVAAIEDTIQNHPTQPGKYGLAVFAQSGEVAAVETLPDPPLSDQARVDPVPHLMPLLAQRGEQIPYVRVVADRTGADIGGISASGVSVQREVTGSETFPLRKVHVGGWSHRHYQMAVEEAWKRNAGDVAAAAVDIAERIGAKLIVVGGDVRAVQTFTGRLPKLWQSRVVATTAGSRHAGASDDALDEVTAEAVAEIAGQHVQEVLDRFRAQLADGTASTGLTEVAARLQRGQVDTVLLADDMSSTDTLWIDPENPAQVSVDDHVLRDAGVTNPQKVRADAALVRAIAGTDAKLVLVGADEAALEHGIGAVLRYAD